MKTNTPVTGPLLITRIQVGLLFGLLVGPLTGCDTAVPTAEAAEAKARGAEPPDAQRRYLFTAARRPKEAAVVRLLGQVVVPASARRVLGPTVEARLVEWSVSVGSSVAAGDTLATLLSPELGDLGAVARELDRVVIERRKRLGTIKRAVNAGFNTSALLNDAVLSLAEAKAQLQRVKAQLAARRTDMRRGEGAGWAWVSPVDGMVTGIQCAPGGLYSAQSQCITIANAAALRVRVDVSERLAHRLGAPGVTKAPSAHWFPSSGAPKATLKFERRSANYDPRTRTQAYYFEGEALQIGASGQVELTVEPPEGAVVVARMAVVEVQGQPTVFVAKGEELPHAVPVTVLGREGSETLVKGPGLSEGARVVSSGAFSLKSSLTFN